jgi:hypothetical protein
MFFKMLEGFDAVDCSKRLYNAGLLYFGYPPHDLDTIKPNSVFVMSQTDPGPVSPEQGTAFGLVVQATAQKYDNVIVRDSSDEYFNMGTIVPVAEMPTTAPAGTLGIPKIISGADAAKCAACLFNASLIPNAGQADAGSVKITSHPQLRADTVDRSQDFDLVVRAAAATFGDAQVSDPELL